MRKIRHSYKVFGIHPSSCNVYVYSDDGEHHVLFEDIDEGTSVTNASEKIASSLVREQGLDPKDCTFYETYRETGYDTFDEISYEWVDGEAINPQWKIVDKDNYIRVMFMEYLKRFV